MRVGVFRHQHKVHNEGAEQRTAKGSPAMQAGVVNFCDGLAQQGTRRMNTADRHHTGAANSEEHHTLLVNFCCDDRYAS